MTFILKRLIKDKENFMQLYKVMICLQRFIILEEWNIYFNKRLLGRYCLYIVLKPHGLFSMTISFLFCIFMRKALKKWEIERSEKRNDGWKVRKKCARMIQKWKLKTKNWKQFWVVPITYLHSVSYFLFIPDLNFQCIFSLHLA